MKISYISFKRKLFLIFRETETPKKILYISGSGNPPKIPLVLGNGTFYISRNGNPEKKSLSFRKRNFFIFQEVTFQAQKIKKTTLKKILISWEMEIYSTKKNLIKLPQKKLDASATIGL